MNQKGWKVLFIDDEEGICKVMSIMLSDAGYEVLTAPDGESGLNICEEESPQIVLTDIRLPGIDGIEVLRRIKEKDPGKEVIAITAYGEMDIAIRALQLNASDFITKPINDEALFMGWFGPRGLASIVFAIMAIDAKIPGADFIAVTVGCTVLLSILAHGLSAKPLSRLLSTRLQDANQPSS